MILNHSVISEMPGSGSRSSLTEPPGGPDLWSSYGSKCAASLKLRYVSDEILPLLLLPLFPPGGPGGAEACPGYRWKVDYAQGASPAHHRARNKINIGNLAE